MMRFSWSLIAPLAAALAIVLVSCDYVPGDTAGSGAPPAIRTPVGPVPGPVENPPRRQNPYSFNSGVPREGRDLFVQMNCSGCHGGRGGGGMGPSLRDVDWIYGSTPAQIFSSVAEGRAHGMPAWGTQLPEDQIWKLVTYIETMRTPQEPEPPR
jgi:cytochrome c oxidase cbb3-type subunit 3